MGELNYKMFIDYANQESFYQTKPIGQLTYILRERVKEHEIVGFYPKGLFIDDDRIELFVFKRDSLLIIKQIEEYTSTKLLFYSHLLEVELFKGLQNQNDIKLCVIFLNNYAFELNSRADTNGFWIHSFGRELIRVFDFIKDRS